MSRQTNPRDLEKRITNLEINGGGGGSTEVKWTDVKNKPFNFISEEDFKITDNTLELKNTGSAGLKHLFVNAEDQTKIGLCEGTKVYVLTVWDNVLTGLWLLDLVDNTITEGTLDDVDDLSDLGYGGLYNDWHIGDNTLTGVYNENSNQFEMSWIDIDGGQSTNYLSVVNYIEGFYPSIKAYTDNSTVTTYVLPQ